MVLASFSIEENLRVDKAVLEDVNNKFCNELTEENVSIKSTKVNRLLIIQFQKQLV